MSAFLPVDTYFSHVYLVDLTPSLCDVARKRFERLGWKNVSVICQDARTFRLPTDSEDETASQERKAHRGADLVTMSYSLSMIPGRNIEISFRQKAANYPMKYIQTIIASSIP
jgi:betaine lipid synthase